MKYDGTKLKRARMAKGYRQTQVAAATGVLQPTISEVESGKCQDPPTFKKLADFYGIALNELIEDEQPA